MKTYMIEDKESAIRTVQNFLGISQNGIYDEQTRLAVMKAQKKYGLNETGITDYETFIVLKEEYEAKRRANEARRRIPTEARFPYSFGDMGSDVTVINALLHEVKERYTIDVLSPLGVFYSDRSEKIVSVLRKIFGMNEGTHIDEEFFYRLTEERKLFLDERKTK